MKRAIYVYMFEFNGAVYLALHFQRLMKELFVCSVKQDGADVVFFILHVTCLSVQANNNNVSPEERDREKKNFVISLQLHS